MNKTHKELDTLSRDMISVLEILMDYCKNNQDCENMIRIFPIIKLLCKKADDLWLAVNKPEEEPE